ncbi:hypothetical protein WMY93_014203 [Mugilogobius chulae]|uniref:Transposase n=1 Tax=Mugilogobius chulae TaxID=88201 RepID=A0AAW0NUN2_9GOBI
MADDIAASSATLSKMSKKLRNICITAVERMRRHKGQVIGGRREFVAIDESHFRHKRKRENVRSMAKKKWVFGMLGINEGKSGRPVLRLVEKRGRQNLYP